MYKKYIKRMLDVLISFLGLVILSPLYLLLAGLVRAKLGSPVIFRQERTGVNGKPFVMCKFRTMTNKTDEQGVLLPDEERQTRFGNFLRSTSLDELPELYNIFKGDCSIIGPRPLPVSYKEYLSPEETVIYSVRGGLIPPDCVSGKTVISWEEQFAYEMEYAKNITFRKDLKILFSVVKIVFRRVETDYGAEVREALPVHRKEWHNDNK